MEAKTLKRNVRKDEIQKTEHRGYGENQERALRKALKAKRKTP